MASIKISELAAVQSVTDDDVLIVNDGDVNTRKITYANLSANLISTGGGQTINGDLTITGNLITDGLVVDTDLITVDTVNDRIGILSQTPACTLDVGGPIQARDGAQVRFADADSSAYVSLQAPAVLGSNTPYTLPGAYPAVDGQFLTSGTNGEMSWLPGLLDPMTTVGDLITRDATNTTARLPVGATGQVLTAQASGEVAWQNSPAGFADPMTSPGDLITRNATNQTTRLGIGTPGQVLRVTAGGEPAWAENNAAAGGNNTEVQFNANGALEGNAQFIFDNTTNRLTVDNFTVVSDALFNGNTVLGNQATDNITVTGVFTTSLIPNINGALDFGANNARWGNIWMASTIAMTEGGAIGGIEMDNLEGYTFSGLGVGNISARLQINDEQNNNGVTLAVPTTAGLTQSYTLTLPGALGQVGEVLTIANAQGDLAWGQGGGAGTPGGNNLEVQFNSNGAFAGNANLTFDPDGDTNRGLLTTTGLIQARSVVSEVTGLITQTAASVYFLEGPVAIQANQTLTQFILSPDGPTTFIVDVSANNVLTGDMCYYKITCIVDDANPNPRVAAIVDSAVTTNPSNDFPVVFVGEQLVGNNLQFDFENTLNSESTITYTVRTL